MMRLFLVIVINLSSNFAIAKNYTPKSDGEIIEKLPRSHESFSARKLRLLEKEARKEPTDTQKISQAAMALLQASKSNRDPRFIGRAQALLSKWWDLEADIPPSLVYIRAYIKQYNHDFTGSLVDVNRYIDHRPNDVAGHLMRVTLHQLLGNYKTAKDFCEQLPMTAHPVLATTCSLWQSSLSGNLALSYKALLLLQDQTINFDIATNTYLLSALADTSLRLGKSKNCEQFLLQILELRPHDHNARSILADLLIENRRYSEALSIVNPLADTDSYLLRAALAAKLANMKEAPQLAEQSLERVLRNSNRGSKIHLRDSIYLYLYLKSDPVAAHAAAKENWGHQKEPLDTLYFAQTSFYLKDEDSIRSIRDWIAKTKFEDVRIDKFLK